MTKNPDTTALRRSLVLRLDALPARSRGLDEGTLSKVFGGCARMKEMCDPNKEGSCCPPYSCIYTAGPTWGSGSTMCRSA